ncbi:ABC transporter ATP-binding protein [Pikeienuella sp. HZG-20]|uniref:ABC transporter ATP-binding protein n=1 Tax=Paludibacillus litoralis TaxID=3133267 RepID=UPI0030EF300F
MTIEAKNIEVRFGGIAALQGVDVTVERGEILAVIGPNGSGKSTLFNAITGFVALSNGDVSIDGESLAGVPAHQRISRGVSRTFQTPRIDPTATVEDAVLCGFHTGSKNGLFSGLFRPAALRRSEKDLRARRDELLEGLELSGVAKQKTGELPMGLIRMVDIARAMAAEPRFLLLDEPAAGLSKAEQNVFIQQVRKVAARNVGVLLVEHNFGLVKKLANRLIVFDRGKVLLRGTAQEVSRRPEFISAYLGTGTH